MIEIKHTIVLPVVDKVHEVLYSFLRTSDWGEWAQNPEIPSDPFVLHFCRGQKATHRLGGFLGIGGREVLARNYPSWHPRDIFMLLKVTVRPSPSTIRVNLSYSLMPFFGQPDKNERAIESVCMYMEDEVKALVAYLKECYELPELPTITCE